MIKVYGDSHSRIFKKIKLKNHIMSVENISGASLSGLPNRESKLKIRNRIINFLKNNKPSYLILKFGQVDIDLGYYYRIVVKNQNIDHKIYINNMIKNYILFIKDISKYISIDKIIVFGINPPSLIDKNRCVDYTKRIIFENNSEFNNNTDFKNKLIKTIKNIQNRTEFSKLFNNTCKYYCNKNNIKYSEVFDELLDNDKIISKKFTNNNDHHIKGVENDESNFEPTNKLFKNALLKIIN